MSQARALVGVLLLHRTLPAEVIQVAMRQGITTGRFDPDVLAVMARAHRDATPVSPIGLDPTLPAGTRPLPTLAAAGGHLRGRSGVCALVTGLRGSLITRS